MDALDQARRYLNAIPLASEGHRNDSLNRAAYAVIERFNLSEQELTTLLLDWSQHCIPPIPHTEAEKTIHSAYTAAQSKGTIGTRKGIRHTYRPPTAPRQPSAEPHRSNPQPAIRPPQSFSPSPLGPIPSPLPDGARALLAAAFQPGEGVRICIARTNEEGREVPRDAGVTLTREEWLKKLESSHGDPNKFLRTGDRNGIFISINPLQIGGSRDADVTSYRHVLLEWDHISTDEQWNLITQSRVPATAVIYSGGDSLHAWVRVDARDRAEYDQRVKILYGHFAEYGLDPQNKNPSRFSRLPNCVRFDKRQELLALNIGAESFTAWQMDHDAAELGQEIQVKDLLEFVPSEDKNSILGNRWLCRGGSCLFVGQSGIGKSSLEMQLAILWALERPAFGICPSKPLKSLVVQAENDLGDTAEMFQGVWQGMKLPGADQPEVIRQVQNNLIIRKVSSHTGPAFCELLRRLIDRYKPDLVWLDPALAYIGDDISKQSVCSNFFRNGLNPIADATGVIFMILHHTGKPPKDPKSKSGWQSTDFSYEGVGSSDLTNWARAICVLRRFDENLFELMLPKRGKRAGARDPRGQTTTSLWLRHSRDGICWEQIDAPTEEEQEKVRTKYKAQTKPGKTFDYDAFLETIKGEYFNVRQLVERAMKFSGFGERTVYAKIAPELKKRMRLDEDSRTYTL